MATSQLEGHDAIQPSPPVIGSDPTARKSSSSSADKDLIDAKDSSPAQYEIDPEKQSTRVGSVRREGSEDEPQGWRAKWGFSTLWHRFKLLRHILVWALFTTWWIYGLVRFRHTEGKGWLIPTLVYIGLTMRLVFWWVPSRHAMRPIRWVWQHSAYKVYEAIPAKFHQPLAALITLAVFLIGGFVPEETEQNKRVDRLAGLGGLLLMIAMISVFSRDFKRIPWHTVIGGMLTQFVIAVFVLRTKPGYDIFFFISDMARTLLGFAKKGLVFLTAESILEVTWFLVTVLPAIIFFIALVGMLYHIGFLQWFVAKFAVFFFWSLRVSGAEAIVATATPFIGQGESAMLIRPWIRHLTMSELHLVMTCGFATIAGSILVVYISMGLNSQALMSSCIMSIPASLAVSKLRYPETEKSMTAGTVELPKEDEDDGAVNALHSFSNGAWLGIKIAATIIASILCIIALVGLIDGLLGWWGGYWGLDNPKLQLELILGYLLYPVARLIGVPGPDLLSVSKLIGMKIVINEFYAFDKLQSEAPFNEMAERSKLIATYALCGFGNIGSLGIQIGVLSQLSPKRAPDVLRVAVSALICGILATLSSASIAGMLYVDGMLGPAKVAAS